MNYLLLSLSVVILALHAAYSNIFSKKALKNNADVFLFNTFVGLAACVALTLISTNLQIPSTYTVIWAVVFGAITVLSQISLLRALSLGSMTYTILFSSCGMIIPTIIGVVFWQETVRVSQIVGLLLLLVVFYFSTNPKKDERITVRWLIFALCTFLFSGLIGIIQKIHQTSAHLSEINEFLVIAFLTSTLLSFVMYCYQVKIQKVKRTFKLKSRTPIDGAVVGICIGIVNKLNLYLSGKMPSIIFFPLVNGAVILTTAIVSILFFKEKLSKIQYISILVGILAIALISVKF